MVAFTGRQPIVWQSAPIGPGPTGLIGVTDYTHAAGGAAAVYTPIADATGTIVALVDAWTGQVAASFQYGDIKGAGDIKRAASHCVCSRRFYFFDHASFPSEFSGWGLLSSPTSSA